MDDRLQQVQYAAARLRDLRTRYGQAVVDFESNIAAAQADLDSQIEHAVDKEGYTVTAISRVAGYKSHAAVRDAKRRVKERNEAEVR